MADKHKRIKLVNGKTQAGLEEAFKHLGYELRYNIRANSVDWRTDKSLGPYGWDAVGNADLESMVEYLAHMFSYGSGRNQTSLRWASDTKLYSAMVAAAYRPGFGDPAPVDPLITDWIEPLEDKAWDEVDYHYELPWQLWRTPKDEFYPLAVWFVENMICGAIQRAYHPGCVMQAMGLLIGGQEVGKSAFGKCLLPKFLRSRGIQQNFRFSAQNNKDNFDNMRNVIYAEFADMRKLSGKESEAFKAFVTTTYDMLRPVWGTVTESFGRRSIMYATANSSTPLPNDPTGNRRLVGIPCPGPSPADLAGCDLEAEDWTKRQLSVHVEGNIEQLWLQGIHKNRNGVTGNLPANLARLRDRRNNVFTLSTPIEDSVRVLIDNEVGPVPVTEIYVRLGLTTLLSETPSMYVKRQVSDAMQKLGIDSKTPRIGDDKKTTRCWMLPGEYEPYRLPHRPEDPTW